MKHTNAQLRDRIAQLEKENTPLLLALADLVRGETVWFGRGEYRIGISRPHSACGGIVIEQMSGSTCGAYYFSEWAPRALEHISYVITGENNEANAELLRRRKAIEQAQAHISAALRAA
jgi:hypothetical protein